MISRSYCKVLLCFITFSFFVSLSCKSQVEVAPLSCYPQYASIAEMNAAALASSATTPFATWKGAFDYATANGVNTINFTSGTYFPGGASGLSSEWGDASGGFVIPAGMTVNGNGAVIDNSANANSIAFATIGGNNVTVDGFTFVQFTGNNSGAMLVNSGLTGWTISNCNFDHNDWAGDGLVVNQGAGSTGTITGCNFYNHIQSTGSAMTVNGAGGDLDIINTVYSCNSRIVAGGAVRILSSAKVDFDGCTFDGNLTNSASGGAISIEENSVVTFTNTNFTCNTAIVNVQDDGGAMHIIEGSDVTITGCNFTGNEAQDKGGAIHVSGASASLVKLNISGTEFHNNEAQTATSYGGAIWMDGFTTATNISGNYFSGNQSIGGNTNGGGGGIYFAGGTGPGVLTFNNNTFTGNTSGNGNGNAIRTEIDFEGTGNSIAGDIFTQCTSPGPGFFNYAGDDFDGGLNPLWTPGPGTTLTNSGGTYMFIDHSDQGSVYYDASASPMNSTCSYNTTLSSNTETVTWTFTISNATGLDGFAPNVDGMAFVLGATSNDFFAATTNGYAVFFDRLNNTDIDLTYFTGGLDADNATIVCSNTNGISSGNSSASVRVSYTAPDLWTLEYDWSNGSSTDLDVDPRGDNGSCMGPPEVSESGTDATYTGSDLKFTGFAMSGSNGTRIDYYHTRVGDGCTNETGWGGSPLAATCAACLSTTNPSDDCVDQGSISGVTFDDSANNDGIDDGVPLAGVTVELFNCDGSTTGISVTTGATGEFYFGGLENGSCYYLTFTPPGGYFSTYQDAAGSTPSNDSDLNPTTGLSPQITINSTPNSVDEDDDVNNETHYITVDAGFTTTPLPVSITFFKVSAENCQAVLKWETASEVNNEKFEIQQSMDGRIFNTIGDIKGMGTSSITNNYEFYDKSVESDQYYYYRLKQIDFDGRFDYSDTKQLKIKECKGLKENFSIYPSLLSNNEFLTIESTNQSESLDVKIFNTTGQMMYSRNNISFIESDQIKITIDNLRTGLYYLAILENEKIIKTQRIMKQ